MIVLIIRTDKPEAELGLYEDGHQIAYETWLADRQLTKTIHKKIQTILNKSSIEMEDIEGIVVFEGPGSFTGLRIGVTVANALASANQIPIMAAGGSKWIETGLNNLTDGQDDKIALPKYGSPPNITKPRK